MKLLRALSTLARTIERIATLPVRALRYLFSTLLFNPRLGKFRFVIAPFALYLLFALTLTYVYAPLRGAIGQFWMARVLNYANERSMGTAVAGADGDFIGILDPVLDSEKDLNLSGRPIETPDYIAYPDHKALHVDEAPPHYWRCLIYQEDRHIGGLINPFGIDLFGVLRIPLSTLRRSIESGSLSLGVGGSTISMQLARTFFKSPPSREESAFEKLSRKFKEWWLAPVIQWRLARGGENAPIRVWAANHFPHAQRTGGQPLYGVEQTSLILFGKRAAETSIAEQYVLAAAVNQPVILLTGSDFMERLQRTTWGRVVGSRARRCAEALLSNPARRRQTVTELIEMAKTSPTAAIAAAMEQAVAELAPERAEVVRVNPIVRTNTMLPSVKYAARAELRDAYGFGWRRAVRAVQLTLDAADNLRFRERLTAALAEADRRFGHRLAPGFTLNVAQRDATGVGRAPDIVIAAADADGQLVRYFEGNFTAAYYGAAAARDDKTGRYDPRQESRAIASVGKMAAAVAIANDGGRRDGKWLDTSAPTTGLKTCKRGRERRLRNAELSFACSLNAPLEWRAARVPFAQLNRVRSAFNLTPLDPLTSGPNLAKSLIVGQIAASPRTVHRMSATVLAALEGDPAVSYPTLLKEVRTAKGAKPFPRASELNPSTLVEQDSGAALKAFLSAPLCHERGTLRQLGDWCAGRRRGVELHFAKTGTRGTGSMTPAAPDTVDLWIAGGIAFASGKSYSYVLMMGTGNPSKPFARDLYAGRTLAPLVRILLEDLEELAASETRADVDVNGAIH